MEFIFECSHRYRTSERSSVHVLFCLLYKLTDDGVFDDFPKISDHFPKISEDFPKLFRRPDERSWTFYENFRKFPKMSEDFRRLPKTIEEDLKMFRWHTNYFKYNLRDKLGISEIIDIFTCEDIISSHVRMWYRFYEFVTTRYTVDFYIIIKNYSPKWRWLAVDIYRAAKRRGKYPTLATDTEVNSCFSIY